MGTSTDQRAAIEEILFRVESSLSKGKEGKEVDFNFLNPFLPAMGTGYLEGLAHTAV